MDSRLFAYNRNVDDYNQQKLDALPTSPVEYIADDSGSMIISSISFIGSESGLYQLSKNCAAVSRLCVKRGAQVMLLKNLEVERGLVNGARGVVVSFRVCSESGERLPVIRWKAKKGDVTRLCERAEFKIESAGKVIACRRQLPIRLVRTISLCDVGMGNVNSQITRNDN